LLCSLQNLFQYIEQRKKLTDYVGDPPNHRAFYKLSADLKTIDVLLELLIANSGSEITCREVPNRTSML
jgi:hypothetical protein